MGSTPSHQSSTTRHRSSSIKRAPTTTISNTTSSSSSNSRTTSSTTLRDSHISTYTDTHDSQITISKYLPQSHSSPSSADSIQLTPYTYRHHPIPFSFPFPPSWHVIEYDLLVYYFTPIQVRYEERQASKKKDNVNIQVHVSGSNINDFISEWFESANVHHLEVLERDETVIVDGKYSKRVIVKCKFIQGIEIIQKTYFIEAGCGLIYTVSYTSNCGMPNDYIFERMLREGKFPTYTECFWQNFECDRPYIRIKYPALWSHEQVNYFFSPIQLLTRNKSKEQFALVFDQTGSSRLMDDIIDAVKKKNTGVVVHYSKRPCRISNVRALVTYLSHDYPTENTVGGTGAATTTTSNSQNRGGTPTIPSSMMITSASHDTIRQNGGSLEDEDDIGEHDTLGDDGGESSSIGGGGISAGDASVSQSGALSSSSGTPARLEKIIYTVPAKEQFRAWMFLYVSSTGLKSLDLWKKTIESIDLGFQEPTDYEFQFWSNLSENRYQMHYVDLNIGFHDETDDSERFESTADESKSAAVLASHLGGSPDSASTLELFDKNRALSSSGNAVTNQPNSYL